MLINVATIRWPLSLEVQDIDLLLIIVFDNKKVDGKKIATALQTTASVVCSPSFAIIYASASEYANAIPTYETRR